MHFLESFSGRSEGLFIFVLRGPESLLYTVANLRYGEGCNAFSVSWVRVGFLCLEELSAFEIPEHVKVDSSKKPDAFPQRMLKSRSA